MISDHFTYGKLLKFTLMSILMMIFTSIYGVLLSLFGFVFIKPISLLLGAEGQMLKGCIRYGRIILMSVPAYMLQYEFQSLFVTAGKPQPELLVTVAAGVTNSAVILFLRTVVFQVAAVLIFSLIRDIDGIWISIAAVEFMAAAVALTLIAVKRRKYKY